MSKMNFTQVHQSDETIGEIAFRNLKALCAIDSQSDEASLTLPSSDGQKVVAGHLRDKFTKLGLGVYFDANMNVIVEIPPSSDTYDKIPPIALMVHMDTSEGTVANQQLYEISNWDGGTIPFPANPQLVVNSDVYQHISRLRGQSIIHGEGKAPYGLDNKNGASELETLAELLISNPTVAHGRILLCFRCDEEIGRHEGVESLAEELKKAGVTYGWTVDGFVPFEINVRNFNASKAEVAFEPKALTLDAKFAREISFDITGVDTHGATAMAEGYLNATIIFADLFQKLKENKSIVPVYFDRISGKETSGRVSFLLMSEEECHLTAMKEDILSLFEARIKPHRSGGAEYTVKTDRTISDISAEKYTDGAIAVGEHLTQFLSESSVKPLLSEQSDGNSGYSNPYKVSYREGSVVVEYRLRDFSKEYLEVRESDLQRICSSHRSGEVTIFQQYEDMSSQLADSPQLLQLPLAAFAPLASKTSFPCEDLIVRGGTGVDAFSSKGILIGNLGAGYFFLESAKEITSRELLTLHTLWLVNLVQAVALSAIS